MFASSQELKCFFLSDEENFDSHPVFIFILHSRKLRVKCEAEILHILAAFGLFMTMRLSIKYLQFVDKEINHTHYG